MLKYKYTIAEYAKSVKMGGSCTHLHIDIPMGMSGNLIEAGEYMQNTSLCYISCNNKVLMLYRNRKPDDPNAGKWIGIGGRFEENESPEECMLREVREETGIELKAWKYRGIVTFASDRWEGEYMHLFTGVSSDFEVSSCNEGDLCWIDKDKVSSLNLWEGDRVFLKLLEEDEEFFSLKLTYRGDSLESSTLNGEVL